MTLGRVRGSMMLNGSDIAIVDALWRSAVRSMPVGVWAHTFWKTRQCRHNKAHEIE